MKIDRPLTRFSDLAFLADGSVLGCGIEQSKTAPSQRGLVARFDADRGTVLDSQVYEEGLQPKTLSHARQVFACVSTGYNKVFVRRWQPKASGGEAIKSELEGYPLAELALTPNGTTLAVTGGGRPARNVQLWDISGTDPKKGQLLTFGGSREPRLMCFSPDGNRLAIATQVDALAISGDLLYVWDPIAGKERTNGEAKPKPSGQLTALAWSKDSKVIATASSDRAVTLWEVSSLTRLAEWRYPGVVHAVAFDPAGTKLATGNSNGSVYLLDVSEFMKKAK